MSQEVETLLKGIPPDQRAQETDTLIVEESAMVPLLRSPGCRRGQHLILVEQGASLVSGNIFWQWIHECTEKMYPTLFLVKCKPRLDREVEEISGARSCSTNGLHGE
jgi:hypothetical protein